VALVTYGCTVAGEPSDSVDFQVRLFDSDSIADVAAQLRAEPPHEYKNGDGEIVSWPLASILDIQRLSPEAQSGAEVAGTITSLGQLAQHLPASAL